MNRFSQNLQNYIDQKRSWLIYRGEHNLYYPSDPRFKGLEHWTEHDPYRHEHENKLYILRKSLTNEEVLFLDPPLLLGMQWLHENYELKILMRLRGQMLEYGWPSPWCHIIGHVRAIEDDTSHRFVCMNCWKLYDRDPSDLSVIVGGPDEAWIANAIEQARRSANPSAARGVPRRTLQLESSMEDVQDEAEVEVIPGDGQTRQPE